MAVLSSSKGWHHVDRDRVISEKDRAFWERKRICRYPRCGTPRINTGYGTSRLEFP